MSDESDAMHVVVGICTCRNPTGLTTLLTILDAHEARYRFSIVVVDNDPGGDGLAVVAGFDARHHLEAIAEPRSGIPFARNALISAASRHSADYLVMIDDDEVPAEGWLDAMVNTAIREKADVVGGVVYPRFEEPPTPPVQADDFLKDGPAVIKGRLAIDSTANILFSRRLLENWREPFFSETYAMSGGSDSELLRRTQRAGYIHAFASDAVVLEDIPRGRLAPEWLLRRHYRNGNVLGRIEIHHHGYVRALLGAGPRGALLIVRGLARTILPRGLNRRKFAGRIDIARGSGILAALRGSRYDEYSPERYRSNSA